MNRERRLLLISILIFTALGVYYLRPGWLTQLSKKKITSTAAKPQPPQAAPQGITGKGLPEVKVQSEVIDENTPWGRNPFLTEAEAARGNAPVTAGLDGLKVKAIIMGRPKPVATIDGKTVAVGEKIGEETVVEIRQDSVVLEMEGSKRILRVSEPSISIEVKEGKK